MKDFYATYPQCQKCILRHSRWLDAGYRQSHQTAMIDAIYDLQGNRLNEMHKGINIVGGKKVLIK